MRKWGLLWLLFAFASVQAQNIVESLEQNVPGQGKVTIHQEPAVKALVGSERPATDEKKVVKASGFRVQVYAGANSGKARDEAYGMAARVKEHFPDLKVYTFFSSPRWLCRVGDFRSIEEADAVLRKLKSTGGFREASIVREQVNITL